MNRQQALNQLRLMQAWHEDFGDGPNDDYDAICYAIGVIEEMPAGTDSISRKQAIDALNEVVKDHSITDFDAIASILDLPPAQPERRCVNCGRTVNNGGWYEDGRTRCPIEEHYALPKDGYCHLWEKRKDWEDDYVKRAEEGEK